MGAIGSKLSCPEIIIQKYLNEKIDYSNCFLCVNQKRLCSTGKSDMFIDSFVKRNNFNGTIFIKQNSKVVYERSFGLANFPFKVPNTIDTKYKVASITKAFTSVLILQLYEQGKIDFGKTYKYLFARL